MSKSLLETSAPRSVERSPFRFLNRVATCSKAFHFLIYHQADYQSESKIFVTEWGKESRRRGRGGRAERRRKEDVPLYVQRVNPVIGTEEGVIDPLSPPETLSPDQFQVPARKEGGRDGWKGEIDASVSKGRKRGMMRRLNEPVQDPVPQLEGHIKVVRAGRGMKAEGGKQNEQDVDFVCSRVDG